MLCWRCGAQTQGDTCPACGCRQASRRAAATASGTALRSVYDRFGAQRMLTDSDFFRRCLSDMLPDEKAERQRLYTVIQSSAGSRIYDLLCGSGGPSGSDCQELLRLIQAESGMTETMARETLGTILDMIGCDNPFAAHPQPIFTQAYEGERPRNAGPIEVPAYGEIPQRPNPNEQKQADVRILAVKEDANILDATGGLSYWGSFGPSRKGRGRLLVRTDGVAWHTYTGRGPTPDKRACSKDPDFFIPRSEIANVMEHSLAFFHEFTIITRDGRQYRVEGKNAKEPVTEVVNAIRSITAVERKMPS